MTPTQFIDWLKGFTQGVHHYGISPKQWDFLKENLQQVTIPDNNKTYSYTLTQNWVVDIA